jgi:hypothetical protein
MELVKCFRLQIYGCKTQEREVFISYKSVRFGSTFQIAGTYNMLKILLLLQ